MRTGRRSTGTAWALAAALLVAGTGVPSPAAARTRETSSPTISDSVRRHAFLADVMLVLERSRSPIAANTTQAIHDGLLEIDTLDRLTVEDCRQLIDENPRQWQGLAAADDCVAGPNGRARVPAAILARVSGFQHENRVYLNRSVNPSDAAVTVVHEANHVANGTHHRYATDAQKLEEEYRAYWVAIVYADGRAPGAGYLAWLKGWIIQQYGLRGVSPGELPDLPSGILENRFDATTTVAVDG